jgi:hypothetical protein
MPARRKKTTAGKMTAQAAPPEVEEPRAPITQIVEVIEEDIIPIPNESVKAQPPEEPANEEAPSIEQPPQDEPPEVATKKSLVEELYTKDKKSVMMPEISMHRQSSKKPIMVWAIVTIIVAVLVGGILYTASKKSSLPSFFARPTPTPTTAPTSTPTPTPAAIDKTSFDIQVLNGGGAPGAAGKMKSFLEGKGYKVSATGNTSDYTYDTTEIHGKPTMTDEVAHLKTDLKDSYSIGTVATDLDASASADVQVIVGKE